MITKEVLSFIMDKHDGQFRKGSKLPYFFHCVDVINLLVKWGITDIETLNSAGCHDVIEEKPETTREELVSVIGENGANVVYELTFVLVPGRPVKEQKQEYIDSFAKKSIRSVVIKIADRMVNTLDFMPFEIEYAYKYWGFASGLRSIILERSEEIIALYGEKSYYLMQEDVFDRINLC